MGNLKIHDDEHNNFAATIKNVGEIAEQQIETYFTILGDILENAVTAGVIYENLTLFHSQAQVVKNIVGEICNTVNTNDAEYLIEIDKKDEYLY